MTVLAPSTNDDDLVWLEWRRNRGWPWPDESWGLDPMFGPDGWCKECGTPNREQIGPLVLRGKGLKPATGAWVPNWRFDTVCVSADVARGITTSYPALSLDPVSWRGGETDEALQFRIPVGEHWWFDPEALSERAAARHGAAGTRCETCHIWRWYPLPYTELPEIERPALDEAGDVLASPEWFGDGYQSTHVVMIRRGLARLLAQLSPQDFRMPPPHL